MCFVSVPCKKACWHCAEADIIIVAIIVVHILNKHSQFHLLTACGVFEIWFENHRHQNGLPLAPAYIFSSRGAPPTMYNLLERFILSWGASRALKSDYRDGIPSSKVGLDGGRPQGIKPLVSYCNSTSFILEWAVHFWTLNLRLARWNERLGFQGIISRWPYKTTEELLYRSY